jgi:5-methyltetrahydrofolate--homocysteine methyltransferase
MSSFQALSEAIIKADQKIALAEMKNLLDAGTPVQEILDKGLILPMDEVGERFSKGTMFVPQMLRSAKIMQVCVETLKPSFQEGAISFKGKVLIGTVAGDLHDIGKNLVAMMLEGAGFSVIDLGVDVSPEKFIDALKTEKAEVLAMSALLSTTMPSMQATIEALKKEGVRKNVKVIIGGAPVTEDFARKIQADAYAPDAGSCVVEVKKLVKNAG